MKAIMYEKYGSPEVLHVTEIDKPSPANNEVLVRNHACTVTLYDCWLRQGTGPAGFGLLSRIASGFFKPKQPVLGTEFAGEVEVVGKDVTRFKPGDAVFGFTGERMGTYAEYVCMPEDGMIAPKPSNLTYEESASVPYGSLTALFFLSKANIQPGQKVLIFGASGGVGSAAVQLAKHMGAEVTGVCSTSKMEMVKAIGADHVIDYTRDDFTKYGKKYDVIFDTIGRSPFAGSLKSLHDDGYYLFATFGLTRILRILWRQRISKTQFGPLGVVEEDVDDLIFLKDMIEGGRMKPYIDRCFPLDHAAEAHRYVEAGQKQGNVIITISHKTHFQ